MNKLRDALQCIPPFDRDVWVRMAMAVKAEMGGDGYDVWAAWSQQADSFNERDARAVWKSVKSAGGITGASLYKLAIEHGWKGEAPIEASEDDRRARLAADARERAERERRQAMAAKRAAALLTTCEHRPHDYLALKGFPDAPALVAPDAAMVVPMRDVQNNALLGAQVIRFDAGTWDKKMLPGMRAKGAVLRLGPRRTTESALCEGYATGLSIEAAARVLCLSAAVYVTFSANNLAHVAPLIQGKRYVIADHDASGTGQTVADATGLPWVMSDRMGEDANDMHQRAGVFALSRLLMAARSASAGGRAA